MVGLFPTTKNKNEKSYGNFQEPSERNWCYKGIYFIQVEDSYKIQNTNIQIQK